MEGCLGGEDALAQVLWGVGVGQLEPSLDRIAKRGWHSVSRIVPRGIARAAGAADGDHGSGALAAKLHSGGFSAWHRRHFMSGPSRAGRRRMSKPRLASWLGEVKDGTGQLDGGPGESGLRGFPSGPSANVAWPYPCGADCPDADRRRG